MDLNLENIRGVNMNCEKCKGKGYYYYDEIHGKICELCCPHDAGWDRLSRYFGQKNEMEICKRGCGTERSTPENEALRKATVDYLSFSTDTIADTAIFQTGQFIVKCRYCDKWCVIPDNRSDKSCNRLDCVREREKKVYTGTPKTEGDSFVGES